MAQLVISLTLLVTRRASEGQKTRRRIPRDNKDYFHRSASRIAGNPARQRGTETGRQRDEESLAHASGYQGITLWQNGKQALPPKHTIEGTGPACVR